MKKVSWFLVLLMLAIVPALAVIPTEIQGYDSRYIQIDGDVDPATGSCVGGSPSDCSDWTGLLAPPLDLKHLLPDTIGNNDEDILSPDSVLSDGSSLPKQDITRIWLSNNKDYFYLAEERRANNGTSGWHLFVTHLKPHWVLGDVVTFDFCNYDMEIFICFPSGGKVEDASITVNRIYDPGLPPQALMYPGVIADNIWSLGVFNEQLPFPSATNAVLFAINGVETPAINGAINSHGDPTTTPPYNYPAACFAEAAITLGPDGLNVSSCGTKAYVTVITRSSCKTDRPVGDLKDISYPVLYNFGGPDIEVDPPETTCTTLTGFSATASGGIAPYTFKWYDGEPSPSTLFRTSDPINAEPATDAFNYALPAGEHNVHVVVVDASECDDSGETGLFTVYDPLSLVLTKPIVPDCERKADLSAEANYGAPPYTFKWYDNDVLKYTHVVNGPGPKTDTIEDYVFVAPPEDHTVRVVVTDSRWLLLECFAQDSAGFKVYEDLLVTLAHGEASCDGEVTFTATPSGGNGDYHYEWTVGGSPVGSDSPTYQYGPDADCDPHEVCVLVTDTRFPDPNECEASACETITQTVSSVFE